MNSELIKQGMKNSTYLTLGNILAQLITIVGFLYIARILGAGEFGKYSTVISFVSLFAFISLTGLDRVLLIQGSKDLSQMSEFMSENFNLKLLFTLLSVIICLSVSYFMPYNHELLFLILIFSFSLFFTGLMGYFAPVFQAHERMEYISFFRVFRNLFFTVISIIFLYFGYGLLQVILISLLATFLTSYFYYIYSKSFVNLKIGIYNGIKSDYYKPIIIFSVLGLVTTFSQSFDIIFLSLFATSVEVGLYSLPYSLVLKGVMIRNTLSIGFAPTTIKAIKEGDLKSKNYFVFSFLLLFFVGIGSAVISYFSDNIVSLFGESFSESSDIMRIAIFMLPLAFASIPYVLFLQSTGNEIWVLVSVLLSLLVKITLSFTLYDSYQSIGVVLSSLLSYFTNLFLLCISTYYILYRRDFTHPSENN